MNENNEMPKFDPKFAGMTIVRAIQNIKTCRACGKCPVKSNKGLVKRLEKWGLIRMSELEEIIEEETRKQHDAFASKRINEIEGKQSTFGTPDYELIKPILKELLKDDYRAVIIAVEGKDGVRLMHRSTNSESLTRELKEFLG